MTQKDAMKLREVIAREVGTPPNNKLKDIVSQVIYTVAERKHQWLVIGVDVLTLEPEKFHNEFDYVQWKSKRGIS